MGKILILDDSIRIREACYKALSQEDHKVFTAPLSEEIYTLIKNTKPDLVLADLRKAEQKGMDILKQLSDPTGLKIPVIVYSENIDVTFEKKCTSRAPLKSLTKIFRPKSSSQKWNKF